MFAVTIDGVSSRDLDDAVWCEKLENGFRLSVLIANVADKILPLSPEDNIASERQFSIYSGAKGCVKPMLPRYLSENALSLVQDKNRRVVVVNMELNAACDVLKIDLSTTDFKNKNRLNHDMIPAILEDNNHPLHDGMCLMRDVAERLLDKRRNSGSLVIYDVVSGWSSDENGIMKRLSDVERNIGYVIVQELMILANSQLSEFCLKNNIPIMYRNHQVNMAAPSVKSIASDIETAFASQNENGIKLIARRLALFANKAVMSNVVGGHYGLNLPAYAWFTSPIRRYPDLVNQRNLLAYLRGEDFIHPHEKIALMAESYNKKVVEVDNETSEFHAKRAQEKAAQVLVNENFSNVDSITFYQSIKSFFNSDAEHFPQALQTELFRRAQLSLLDVKTLALLFSQKWRGFSSDCKQKTIQELMNSLPLAVSISNVMTQKYGLSEPQYEFSEEGQDHCRRFICHVSAVYQDMTFRSGRHENSVKKVAGQHAMWSILCEMAGMTHLKTEQHDVKDESSEPLKELPAKVDAATLSNPVGHLQEWCQKRKIGMPTYEYQKVGPDHLPQFQSTVSVSVGGSQVVAIGHVAASKKDAARYAAIQWIDSHV